MSGLIGINSPVRIVSDRITRLREIGTSPVYSKTSSTGPGENVGDIVVSKNNEKVKKILKIWDEYPGKVEYFNYFSKHLVDLWNFIDFLSINAKGHIRFIQAYTDKQADGRSKHFAKMDGTQFNIMRRLLTNPNVSIEFWGYRGVKKTISRKAFFSVFQYNNVTQLGKQEPKRFRVFTDGEIQLL